MSTRWGLGAALGPGGCARPFEQLSARTREALDTEVAERLRASEARAIGVLRARRRELDALAGALLERDTLGAAQVDELLTARISRAAKSWWRTPIVSLLGVAATS
eukprot:6747644-Prymnesium_polylepis.1